MNVPDYEEVAEAFRHPKEVLARLPESTEARRARDHLDIARRYALEARERVRPERVEAAS